MKNRYFGDIYDYYKYALLRRLTDPEGPRTTVCWMLTKDGDGNHGRHTHYLQEPEIWRPLEPALFDFLSRQVLERKIRDVEAIERAKILPNCHFFSEILTDDPKQRTAYFDRLSDLAQESGLVFFDPDNGIEVGSVRYGQRNSSRYLYWKEIEATAAAGHALLIYQHLPPQPRNPYVRRLATRLLRASNGGVIYAIRTRKVVFFLVPRRGSVRRFQNAVSALGYGWRNVLWVSAHRRR